jgi:CRISPR-associated protein Cmr6
MAAYGTVGRLFETPQQLHAGINPGLMLNRAWFGTVDHDVLIDDPAAQTEHLRRVATAIENLPPDLLTALHARRRAAVAALTTSTGTDAVFLTITPMWRVVVGHGEHTIHESGLSLSGPYGVPCWPGSALKGIAAAHARAAGMDPAALANLFGAPREDDRDSEPRAASVTMLDALPTAPPAMVVDVLTPHVKPYYDQVNIPDHAVDIAPAEYHSPVPVRFLAVGATTFGTALIGPREAIHDYRRLLTAAFDTLGIGGKTAAGYGYATVEHS